MQKEADDDSLDGVVLSGSCYDDGFAANEHGSGGIALHSVRRFGLGNDAAGYSGIGASDMQILGIHGT